MLTVKNGNPFNFTGRYDGIDYSFPAGAITAVPEDAARHIFGVGMVDKTDVMVRQGWMHDSASRNSATEILNKFSFNVADNLEPGDVIPAGDAADIKVTGQGSAPLQTGSGAEAVIPDEVPAEASRPTSSRGSILDALSGGA